MGGRGPAHGSTRVIVIEGLNPYGNLAATVEDDGRTVYLYVHHVERRDWGFRALWVRNRAPAPEGADEEARALRVAPRLPRGAVAFPEGAPPLESHRVSLLWLEEGNGVALYEGDELLAVSPPWAGRSEGPGYARDALARAEHAAPLAEGLARLGTRLEDARRTWNRWRSTATWTEERTRALAELEVVLGAHDQYFAADGGEFPPLAIARFSPEPDVHVYVTVGMGAFPMPRAELEHPAPRRVRRIEIAAAVRGEASWPVQVLAWLGRYPWNQDTWLGDGHVVSSPTGQATWFPAERSALLLTAAERLPRDVPLPPLATREDVSGEPITYLWALPITMDERRAATISGPDALLTRLLEEGRAIAETT